MTHANTVVIPLPPSTNGLFSNVRNGGRVVTVKYKNWRAEAGWILRKAQAERIVFPIPGPCWFWAKIELPVKDRGDIDNRHKAAIDLLVSLGLTPDDKWQWRAIQERCEDVDAGTARLSWGLI